MAVVVMLLSGVVLAVTKHCNHNCKGTNGPDYLIGSGSANTLSGLGGGDTLKGLRRGDVLNGAGGDDDLFGGAGDDSIYGGIGHDVLHGKRNGDYINGIDGTTSYSTARKKQRTVDVLTGDRGNDTIKAKDGKKDIIRGGPGYDKAYVDRVGVDKVNGVEKVVRGTGGPKPKQCNDGIDNDGDGKIDLQDSGCASATDDTENSKPIAPQNHPPVAKDDSYSVDKSGDLTVPPPGVLDNDKDVDGDSLTVDTAVVHGPFGPPPGDPSGADPGYLDLKPNGGFVYDPDHSATDSFTDSFTYKATDGVADSNVAKVKITVCDPQDPTPPLPAACP